MPWITETQIIQPKEILVADENLSIQSFLAAASQGNAYRWSGDYHHAKNFLAAVDRRLSKKTITQTEPQSLKESFHKYRLSQAHRARTLSRLLIHIEEDLMIKLPRAPDVKEAIKEAIENIPEGGFDLSLRELLGIIGAHQWRKSGIVINALNEKIFSHYGVFAPVRAEYLELVALAELPQKTHIAFDIGTGTGVIAAILAKRGVKKIVATDSESRALFCAQDNISRLGLSNQIELQKTDLFPEGVADLIVCNPPWLPAKPTSRMEYAVYDFESQMLKRFLRGLNTHLSSDGEAWLIISDLAEIIGLREKDDLMNWITDAGLKVVDRLDTRPRHPKSLDREDPLFAARSKEITSLWRIKKI